jgi:hypothetical protein
MLLNGIKHAPQARTHAGGFISRLLSAKSQALLKLRNCLCRIQPFWTRPGAVQDSMAPVQTHIIVQRLPALGLALIPRVSQPPIALQQDCRAEIFLAVPPVAGTRSAAASAEDALVEAVEFLAVRLRLAVLLAVGRFGVALEVGLDRLILFIEVGEIGDKVFDHVGVRKGIDAGLFGRVGWDTA